MKQLSSMKKQLKPSSRYGNHETKTNDSFTEHFRNDEGSQHNKSLRIPSYQHMANERKPAENIQKTELSSWSDEDTFPSIKGPDSSASSFENPRTSNAKTESSCDILPSTSDDGRKNLSDLLTDFVFRFCPLCLKKNNFNQKSGFIVHLKSCAMKNNISTDQLKQAIQLHQKQTNERNALGLSFAPQPRLNSKRGTVRKGKSDPNLELAMALSVSLRESEVLDKIRETESLLEAGLEKEALSQCKKLENYGFVTSKTENQIPQKILSSSRMKNYRNSVLFNRSKEERERIITEKITNILVDFDSKANQSVPWDSKIREIKSKYIMKRLDENSSLWNKSYHLNKHTEYDCYYIDNLSSFISPCKYEVGSKLRHLSEIPFRSTSPDKTNINNICLDELAHLFTTTNEKTPPIVTTSKSGAAKSDKSKTVCMMQVTSDFGKLSQDWKFLVNNKVSSDITIYAKNETSIYAHKLVFYVRCRAILADTISECQDKKLNEIIMWMEYSSEAVIAFLEYIYCGILPNFRRFTSSQRFDLNSISRRYCFKEFEQLTNEVNFTDDMFLQNNTPDHAFSVAESECITTNITFAPKCESLVLTEGEKNLQLLSEALQNSVSPNVSTGSPEIFEEDNEEELDITETGKIPERKLIIDESVDEILQNTFFISKHSSTDNHGLNRVKNDFSILSDYSKNISQVKELCSFKRKSNSPGEPFDIKKSKVEDISSDSSIMSCGSDILLTELDPVCKLYKSADENAFKNRETCKVVIGHDYFSDSLVKKSTAKDQVDGKENDIEKTEASPYISPVWDRFEDVNYEYSVNFTPDGLQFSPQEQIRINKLPEINKKLSTASKNKGDAKSSDQPYLELFAGDEHALNYIEQGSETLVQEFETQIVNTPSVESIRKFRNSLKADNVQTPISKHGRDVTPIADYSNMKSNELRKELDKYGLKPGLHRTKAKKLLRYIYDELHPFEENLNENNYILNHQTNDERSLNRDGIKQNSVVAEDDVVNSDNASVLSSGIEALEESSTDEDTDASQDSTSYTQTNKVDLHTKFRNLIQNDQSFHKKILLYEPIWLESLKATVEENGVNCSTKELINYLDEQCITYRTKKQGRRCKRKKRGDVS